MGGLLVAIQLMASVWNFQVFNEMSAIKLRQEEFFVRKEEFSKLSDKLDAVRLQIAELQQQVSSLKGEWDAEAECDPLFVGSL